MNENPEFSIPVAIGCLIFAERLPVWAKWPLIVGGVDTWQDGGAFGIIFAAGLLPNLVDAFLIFRGCRSRRTLGMQVAESEHRHRANPDLTN